MPPAQEKEGEEHVRRIAMLLGLTMIIVVVGAGVALAVVKTCGNIPCRGTDNDDVLHERVRNNKGNLHPNGLRDRIFGLDGNDDIDAVTGTSDRDILLGGRKGDRLLSNDGDARDSVRGGAGRDTCFFDQGDARRSCEREEVQPQGVEPAGFGDTSTNPENEPTDPGESTTP